MVAGDVSEPLPDYHYSKTAGVLYLVMRGMEFRKRVKAL